MSKLFGHFTTCHSKKQDRKKEAVFPLCFDFPRFFFDVEKLCLLTVSSLKGPRDMGTGTANISARKITVDLGQRIAIDKIDRPQLWTFSKWIF